MENDGVEMCVWEVIVGGCWAVKHGGRHKVQPAAREKGKSCPVLFSTKMLFTH